MKVLFINNIYPPNVFGGYEQLCYALATEFVSRNHQVSVLTSDYGGKQHDYPGQRIDRSLKILVKEGKMSERLDCSPDELKQINSRNISIFQSTLAQEQPDVVFVWNMFNFDVSLFNAVRTSNRKTVFLLTDYWMIAYTNRKFMDLYFTEQLHSHTIVDMERFKADQRMNKCKKTAIAGNAIFASEFMRELHTESGLSFSDSTVIHHGVNFHDDRNARDVDRSSLVRSPELRLLFAGRVTNLKGVHTIIEALPEVIRALPEMNVRATILGLLQHPIYYESLKRHISNYGLESYIEFRSPVKESELIEVFREHDMYLFPSLYEPFALTLIHALGAGIPTIASNVGGNREIIRDREHGILFSKGNAAQLAAAIVELASDHRLRQTLAHAARQRAGEFTITRMVDRIESYLTSML